MNWEAHSPKYNPNRSQPALASRLPWLAALLVALVFALLPTRAIYAQATAPTDVTPPSGEVVYPEWLLGEWVTWRETEERWVRHNADGTYDATIYSYQTGETNTYSGAWWVEDNYYYFASGVDSPPDYHINPPNYDPTGSDAGGAPGDNDPGDDENPAPGEPIIDETPIFLPLISQSGAVVVSAAAAITGTVPMPAAFVPVDWTNAAGLASAVPVAESSVQAAQEEEYPDPGSLLGPRREPFYMERPTDDSFRVAGNWLGPQSILYMRPDSNGITIDQGLYFVGRWSSWNAGTSTTTVYDLRRDGTYELTAENIFERTEITVSGTWSFGDGQFTLSDGGDGAPLTQYYAVTSRGYFHFLDEPFEGGYPDGLLMVRSSAPSLGDDDPFVGQFTGDGLTLQVVKIGSGYEADIVYEGQLLETQVSVVEGQLHVLAPAADEDEPIVLAADFNGLRVVDDPAAFYLAPDFLHKVAAQPLPNPTGIAGRWVSDSDSDALVNVYFPGGEYLNLTSSGQIGSGQVLGTTAETMTIDPYCDEAYERTTYLVGNQMVTPYKTVTVVDTYTPGSERWALEQQYYRDAYQAIENAQWTARTPIGPLEEDEIWSSWPHPYIGGEVIDPNPTDVFEGATVFEETTAYTWFATGWGCTESGYCSSFLYTFFPSGRVAFFSNIYTSDGGYPWATVTGEETYAWLKYKIEDGRVLVGSGDEINWALTDGRRRLEADYMCFENVEWISED